MTSDESTKPEVSEELGPPSVSEVWNKLSGGDEVNISDVWDDKDAVMGRLWEEFSKGVDIYIERFNVPTQKEEGESNNEFAVRLVKHMRSINEASTGNRSWTGDPAVSLDFGDGAFNCVLGAQIAARACEHASIDTYIGLPAGHAGTVIKSESGSYLFIDVSNDGIAQLEPFQGNADIGDVNMGRIGEILRGREMSPYELIPVISVEESTAITLNNLRTLRDVASRESKFAQRAVSFLELDPKVPYGNSKKYFLPEIFELNNKQRWKEERNRVKERRKYIQENWMESFDKISNKKSL